MPRIYMTESELRHRWNRRSMSDRNMVRCLAELNGCSYEDMRQALVSIHLISDDESIMWNRKSVRWSASEVNEMLRMVEKGYAPAQIADALGRTIKATRTKLFQEGVRFRNGKETVYDSQAHRKNRSYSPSKDVVENR